MQIREVIDKEKDFNIVYNFFYNLMQYHKANETIVKFRFDHSVAFFREEVKAMLNSDGYVTLIAETELGTPMGLIIGILPKREPEKAVTPEIRTLFVGQNYRHSGVGTALVKAMLAKFKELCPDMVGVYIGVSEWNVGAKRLYEKLGFKSTQEKLFLTNETE